MPTEVKCCLMFILRQGAVVPITYYAVT